VVFGAVVILLKFLDWRVVVSLGCVRNCSVPVWNGTTTGKSTRGEGKVFDSSPSTSASFVFVRLLKVALPLMVVLGPRVIREAKRSLASVLPEPTVSIPFLLFAPTSPLETVMSDASVIWSSARRMKLSVESRSGWGNAFKSPNAMPPTASVEMM